MGYFGLDHYNDSDCASDFVSIIENAIGELCEKELADSSNCYNTAGWINIGLFAEVWLKDISIYSEGVLYSSLIKARDLIKKDIEKIEKESNEWRDKDMHLKAYSRIINNLDKIIENAY